MSSWHQYLLLWHGPLPTYHPAETQSTVNEQHRLVSQGLAQPQNTKLIKADDPIHREVAPHSM